MGNGPRYKVQTRYGWFSLDEGSYRDYLAGKLRWIDWPPLRQVSPTVNQDPPPPNVSPQAMELRGKAAREGIAEVLREFSAVPPAPCRQRMHTLPICELNLSARANNGLLRAGVRTFRDLEQLMQSERGIASVRNLGVKSVKEIHEVFLSECYARLLPYEKAEFWQEVLAANKSGLSDAQ